jgi:ribosomal protein S27AE
MGLRKEFKIQMEKSGFIPDEIKEFANGKTSDNKPMDVNTIALSKPFAEMLLSREEWWRKALSPKSLGGFGMTRESAIEAIKNHYKMKGRRTRVRSIWQFLRENYKPKDKILSKKKFSEAVINKSIITRDLGPYGKKLSLRHAPKTLNRRCGYCRGQGSVLNIYSQRQLCPRCGGSGIERQRFI